MFKNLEIKKGNAQAIKFYYDGDISSKKMTFVCKETKSPSADAVILKKTLNNGGDDTQVYITYDPDKRQSLIKVFLIQSDTIDATSNIYFYTLKNDDDNIEIYFGKLYLIDSIIGNAINYASSFRYYIGTTTERTATALGLGSSDEGLVWFYDTDDDTIYLWNGSTWV